MLRNVSRAAASLLLGGSIGFAFWIVVSLSLFAAGFYPDDSRSLTGLQNGVSVTTIAFAIGIGFALSTWMWKKLSRGKFS